MSPLKNSIKSVFNVDVNKIGQGRLFVKGSYDKRVGASRDSGLKGQLKKVQRLGRHSATKNLSNKNLEQIYDLISDPLKKKVTGGANITWRMKRDIMGKARKLVKTKGSNFTYEDRKDLEKIIDNMRQQRRETVFGKSSPATGLSSASGKNGAVSRRDKIVGKLPPSVQSMFKRGGIVNTHSTNQPLTVAETQRQERRKQAKEKMRQILEEQDEERYQRNIQKAGTHKARQVKPEEDIVFGEEYGTIKTTGAKIRYLEEVMKKEINDTIKKEYKKLKKQEQLIRNMASQASSSKRDKILRKHGFIIYDTAKASVSEEELAVGGKQGAPATAKASGDKNDNKKKETKISSSNINQGGGGMFVADLEKHKKPAIPQIMKVEQKISPLQQESGQAVGIESDVNAVNSIKASEKKIGFLTSEGVVANLDKDRNKAPQENKVVNIADAIKRRDKARQEEENEPDEELPLAA